MPVSESAHQAVFLTLCMLGNFACFFVVWIFLSYLFKKKKSFRNTISVKQFGSRSGPLFCPA